MITGASLLYVKCTLQKSLNFSAELMEASKKFSGKNYYLCGAVKTPVGNSRKNRNDSRRKSLGSGSSGICKEI